MSGNEQAARLGALIRERRRANRMSQEELAKTTRVSVRTIQRYEKGKIPDERLSDIETALGLEQGDLAKARASFGPEAEPVAS